MKLKNKRTGEIWDIPKRRYPTVQEDDISFFAEREGEAELFSYKSIAELNEEWEDYKPAEPLIKDEKIRKVVRAWAEANYEDCFYIVSDSKIRDGSGFTMELENDPFAGLEIGHYTLAELCGEEEE